MGIASLTLQHDPSFSSFSASDANIITTALDLAEELLWRYLEIPPQEADYGMFEGPSYGAYAVWLFQRFAIPERHLSEQDYFSDPFFDKVL